LVLLDARSSKATDIGRKGRGPGEFRSLGGIIAPANGTTAYVTDHMSRRLIPVDTGGRMMNALTMPNGVWRFTDARGRLYGTTLFGRRGGTLVDSSYLLRWDARLGAVDTLGAIGSPRASVRAGERRRMYPAGDRWVVLPDGTLLTVNAGTYRVSVRRDRSAPRSHVVPWERTVITAADKVAIEAAARAVPMRMLGGGGDPSDAKGPPPSPKSGVAGYDFPASYPVFEYPISDAIQVSKAPHVWIARLAGPNAKTNIYDVLAPSGHLIARVELPRGMTVKGFGAATVLVADVDADGIARVKEFAYPDIPSPR
jgi:hypothetical protein